ncbi:hypothetical protein F4677DRAFT_413698 [Hypoxylon crocopeplum]|nr:hypothetical protein F4677DRAFT_413698 [Hypoxylon crocopeplum]
MKSLYIHYSLISATFLFFSFPFHVLSSSLASTTGECKPWTWEPDGDLGAATTISAADAPSFTPSAPEQITIQPGEINCRYWATTKSDGECCTCARFIDFYGIELKKFLILNPQIKPDCSNIAPNTEYCVAGFIEPVRAWDGLCGPPHNNATCIGTAKQCCNSETWTCGDTDEDCARGTCYEGVCFGHRVYTTDGKCGYKHGNGQCAGKWGDCCSIDGECGTGEDFCGEGRCSSGNCNPPIVPLPASTTTVSSTDSNVEVAPGEL